MSDAAGGDGRPRPARLGDEHERRPRRPPTSSTPTPPTRTNCTVRAAKDWHDRFGIEHTTLQIERGGDGCRLASDELV